MLIHFLEKKTVDAFDPNYWKNTCVSHEFLSFLGHPIDRCALGIMSCFPEILSTYQCLQMFWFKGKKDWENVNLYFSF